MSTLSVVPPETIRVKRKRGDDTTPVAFLQLAEASKRQCSGSGSGWVYQRVTAEASASHEIRPVIHSSKPEAGHLPIKQIIPHGDAAASPPNDEQELRQFYLSKTSFVAGSEGPESPVKATKKRRYTTAVFMERDAKKLQHGISATQGEPTHHTVSLEAGPAPRETPSGLEVNQPTIGLEMMDVDTEATTTEPRALKRPGRSSRVKQPTGPNKATPPVAAAQPPLPQLHGDMDRVAADMNTWTLNEIQRNLDGLDQQQTDLDQQQTSPVRPGSRDALKFQPRVPVRRNADHPPRQATAAAPGGDAMTLDVAQDSTEDWVEVVYQRVPASKMDGTIPRKDIGMIVFEDEEEKEVFYGATEGDSDAEAFQDEDDENAEDHYGADYPEDEVSSDDEYGFNPYKYRANASDDEEFDDDEFNSYSADEEGGITAGDNDAEVIRKIRNFVARHSGQ